MPFWVETITNDDLLQILVSLLQTTVDVNVNLCKSLYRHVEREISNGSQRAALLLSQGSFYHFSSQAHCNPQIDHPCKV